MLKPQHTHWRAALATHHPGKAVISIHLVHVETVRLPLHFPNFAGEMKARPDPRDDLRYCM